MMLDPSRMTPTYDESLCRAIGESGVELDLFTRRQRDGEPRLATESFRQRRHFYRWSEAIRRRLPALSQVAKIGEHLTDLARLARTLRSERHELLHVQWLVVPALDFLFIKWARRRVPVVITIHDTNPLHGVTNWSPQKLGTDKCIANAHALVVHTEFSRRQIRQRTRASQAVEICRHGVEPVDRHEPSDDGTFSLLMFGRIRPYKGVDVLLDALALIPRERLDTISVRIAGSPLMDTEPLKTLATSHGVGDRVTWDLRFLDEDEVAEAFRSTHVLVLPYRDIDASGVLYQAAGYGVGIVASDLGGFSDDLEHERTALLVEPDDPEALASAILRLQDDRMLLRSIRTGLAADGDANTWANTAACTVQLYQRLIRERNTA